MTHASGGSTSSAGAGGVDPRHEGEAAAGDDEQHSAEHEEPGRHHALRSWGSTLATVVITVLVLMTVRHTLVDWYKVPSESMQQLLQPGDLILVDMRKRGELPQRGSVVVFDGTNTFGNNPGPIYVKRVIGVGGDRVKCCTNDGRLVVNGKPIKEPYVFPGDDPSTLTFDVEVPPGKAWMMGDHRSVSGDSREHLGSPGGGMVPASDIIGPVTAVVWPWSRHQRIG